MPKLTAEQKIKRALIKVLRQEPFYASILLKHEIREMSEEEQKEMPTICIDGREIRYCPDFIHEVRETSLPVILIHEAMHIALSHHIRLLSIKIRLCF